MMPVVIVACTVQGAKQFLVQAWGVFNPECCSGLERFRPSRLAGVMSWVQFSGLERLRPSRLAGLVSWVQFSGLAWPRPSSESDLVLWLQLSGWRGSAQAWRAFCYGGNKLVGARVVLRRACLPGGI